VIDQIPLRCPVQGNRRSHFARAVHSRHTIPGRYGTILLQRTPYSALSVWRKTPKTVPSPWDFVTLPGMDHRQHAQNNWQRSRVRFRRYRRGQTDRHTRRKTYSSQYFAAAPAGEVIMVEFTSPTRRSCRVALASAM